MKIKYNLFKASILSTSFIFASSFASFSAFSKTNLTIGSSASIESIKAYYPSVKAGTKWIYTSKTNMGSMEVAKFDLVTEVTKVAGDMVTLKATGAGLNINKTVKRSDFSPISSNDPQLKNVIYKYQGTENVSTPAGNFSGADKYISVTNSAGSKVETKVWLVKGTGPVKTEVKSTASGMVINSSVILKKFIP